MLGGTAGALPLAAATMDSAWLSTVVHHLPDLPAAARELRRVLRPGARVLIRAAFPGRHHGIGLFRYWPEPVRQVTAPSLAAIAARARRETHTPLMLISDSAYEAGLARLRVAAATQRGPAVDTLRWPAPG